MFCEVTSNFFYTKIILTSLLLFRYLMHQILLAVQAEESIFEGIKTEMAEGEAEVLYSLRPGITFHFFSSQAPCKLFDGIIVMLFSIIP